MTNINRVLQSRLEAKLFTDSKAIVLLGARQVGKTTLLSSILSTKKKVLHLNGDVSDHRDLLAQFSESKAKDLLAGFDILCIDEAQRIAGIGLAVKIIIDQLGKKVLLSGSSVLELNAEIQESLTGRKWTYELFPFCWTELEKEFGYAKMTTQLEQLLVYGSYPDVYLNPTERPQLLTELTSSYLFKDILALSGIRKPAMLEKLVKALAYQVSSEFSLQELSRTVGVDIKTVDHYISLLEQSFIVFRLGSYKRNLRTELNSKQKIYFWDNGVRNALISDYTQFSLRQDKGALWENFIVSEILKKASYEKDYGRFHFWRTTRQQEIDLLHVKDGKIAAFEIKWTEKRKVKFTKTFTEAYPEAECQVIHKENFRDFLK